MLKAHVRLLKDQLNSLKREDSNGCNMELVRRKVADAKRGRKKLAVGFRRNIFGSYASLRHSVNQSLITVSSRLKRMFDSEAKTLQQSVHDVYCDSASNVQNSFFDAPEAVKRSLSLIVGYSKRDASLRQRSLFAHSAHCGKRQSRTRAAFDSGGAAMSSTSWSPTLAFLDATGPRDYLGGC